MQEFFSDPYDNESFGIITGTFALSRMPNIHGKLFALQAPATNSYPIHIGNAQSTGSYPTNPKLPFSIAPGDTVGWINIPSLDRYYIAGCSGSCYLQYWAMG